MFRVYWTEQQEQAVQIHFKDFEMSSMCEALEFMESLRSLQQAGQVIRHITMSAENPNSIGKLGVADPPADYQWKKRRL